MTMYVFPDDGGKPEKQPIPDRGKERVQAMHNAIVEAAAENDEDLMERYFEQGELSEEELCRRPAHRHRPSRTIFPGILACACAIWAAAASWASSTTFAPLPSTGPRPNSPAAVP
jgi:translation elongation factor EF-G